MPFTYRYNGLDVREEVILTQLLGYLQALGVEKISVLDFHLDRSLTTADILCGGVTDYVIAVRETGDNVHYALRFASWLSRNGAERIWLYGQTARLSKLGALPPRVRVVAHDEHELASQLGLRPDASLDFMKGLTPSLYFERANLTQWQRSRLRGTIETTRGCHFPCRFCFINTGKNHSRRWAMRSPSAAVNDIRAYADRGVRGLVFHDSEFIGGSSHDIANRRELAERLLAEAIPVYYKIYARADTLAKMPDLDLLQRSGLVSAFIGVESLVQSDLDALGKATTVDLIEAAVVQLAQAGIYMDLSFIMFHRNTTVITLRANINSLMRLYTGPHSRYLGMPHFTFSFESGWGRVDAAQLSKKTYVGWDVRMKSPAAKGGCFDPALEPYMEVCRLLSYEWSKKVIALNLARDIASDSEKEDIERWFSSLASFCLGMMETFLGQFEAGQLTIDSLPEAQAHLFDCVTKFYQILPPNMRHLETWHSHALEINYKENSGLAERKEYWLDVIPTDQVFAEDWSSPTHASAV
ncbi:MAG: B12-binding domain-containing radical SAM protein [Betaproteobacteria bacterium]